MTTSRREFLAAGAAGLAAAPLLADDTRPMGPPTAITEAEKKSNAALSARTPSDGDLPPFQPTTLFLTWHRDPTTTMTIQWIGTVGETADPKVYYKRTVDEKYLTAEPVLKPYPKTDFKVFRVDLRQLAPGTEHVFRIGKSSPLYRFRTMPAKATNTITFVSGGDCGHNPHTISSNIIAAQQDPSFALIGGDLGYDNGRSVEVSLAFLRYYSKHMVTKDGHLIPMIPCIGNHEVDGGFGQPRSKAPFYYALFDGLYKDTGYATLDFGDYLSLVLLDTGHTSKVAGAQTDWLERTLKARKDHPHTIVAGHVPCYPTARKMEGTDGKPGTGEDQRKHWVPLFEQYRVPVVLEHHDHTFKRTKPLLGGLANDKGVVYLGDGSWGRLRAPQPPEKLRHLAALSMSYHLSVHKIQGDERFHMALDEHGKIMDVIRTGQRTLGA